MVLGLAIMAVGVVFTLDNLGILRADDYLRFWPVALILVGVIKLVDSASTGVGHVSAGLWIIGGGLLLLDSLGKVAIGDWWPLFLVLIGGYIAWQALARPGLRRASRDDTGETLSGFAVMGAVQRASQSDDFKGGDLTAIMGGCEIDLRKARIASGEAVIDTFAFWGGIEIKVPEDWQVICQGLAIMGGFECKTRGPDDASQRLIVTGLAVMGGVEIKN
jgi:predicted membrane protein